MKKIIQNILKTGSTILMLFNFYLIFNNPVFAGFGISPADIYYDHLKPGAKFEQEIVLSHSDINEELNISIEPELGEMESWFEFKPGKIFKLPKGSQRYPIKVIVQVPDDAQLFNYRGIIRIKAFTGEEKSTGVSIVKGARMEVNLITTSINVNSLSIRALNIPDVKENQPIKLIIKAENNGNIETAPDKVTLEVQDLLQKTIETLETDNLQKIPPNVTKDITAEFKTAIGGGEYFGIVKIYLKDEIIRNERLVFKIVAPSKPSSAQTPSGKLSQFGQSLIQNKSKIIGISLLVLSIIATVVLVIFYKKNSKKYFNLIIVLGITILSLTIFGYSYFKENNQSQSKPADSTSNTGTVKGESVVLESEKNESLKPISVTVNDPKKGEYSVYKQSNYKSAIVYTANEDDKFTVLSETPSWFQILLVDGTSGWIPKISIKKIE